MAHPTAFQGYTSFSSAVTAPEPYAAQATNLAPAAATGASSAQTSATNVQEIGVDEPDIVKTDGDRVVTVTDGHLRVVDASTRQVVGSLNLTMYANWQSAQLLTAGDHAIVLLHPSSRLRHRPCHRRPLSRRLGAERHRTARRRPVDRSLR